MKVIKTTVFFLLLISSFSCGGEKRDPMMSQIAGHSYWEIRDVVFKNAEGEGVEWHGESLAQMEDNKIFISYVNDNSCGQENCGESVQLFNSTSDSVEVILQITHGIDDIYPYFSRKVILPGRKLVPAGCRKFCYEKGEATLAYKIVGSKVISN